MPESGSLTAKACHEGAKIEALLVGGKELRQLTVADLRTLILGRGGTVPTPTQLGHSVKKKDLLAAAAAVTAAAAAAVAAASSASVATDAPPVSDEEEQDDAPGSDEEEEDDAMGLGDMSEDDVALALGADV